MEVEATTARATCSKGGQAVVQTGNLVVTALIMAIPFFAGLRLFRNQGRWKWGGITLMVLSIALLAGLLMGIAASYEFTQTITHK